MGTSMAIGICRTATDDAGVQVLRVDDDRSAGPDWLSTLYYATKP
jgi:hypothetical protein